MARHPVQLRVEPPIQTLRIHVVTRSALLLILAAIGCSSIYWILYLLLPTVAALLIMRKGGDRYLAEDGPRLVSILRWLASGYSYLWLLTDVLPTAQGSPVDLRVEVSGHPTAWSALLRLILSLPALLLVAALSLVAIGVWVIGAVCILVAEKMPRFAAQFLALTLRLEFSLAAYHLSLVDRYPVLSGAADDQRVWV